MNSGILLFVLLLGLSLLGLPIYLALGIGTLAALHSAGLAAMVLPQKLFAGMNSSSLLAIPFFILAGSIMSRSITDKLIDVANALIGWIKGSLALVTVLASALFGAISGSGVATASAIGGIMIPAMKKENYPVDFAAAVVAISSIMGPIIPPSVTLIVYASITGVSVRQLFLGSLVPGIILALFLIIYGLFYGKNHNLSAHEKQSSRGVARTFKNSFWALMMPVIILGGIFGGVFTPTEAAVVALAYALFISLLVYRDIKLTEIPGLFIDASIATAAIMIMVGLSKSSSYVIIVSGLPQQILRTFASITDSSFVVLLLLNLLFLIIGMLVEANAAIIMMTPILLPLLKAFGLDMLHFGILMSFNLCIGLVTPPVGLCLLISDQIAEVPLTKVLRALIPMLLISILVLLLISYIPGLTTWLPHLLH